MSDDKQKILRIMQDLEQDYEEGNLSPERYKYFMGKYQQKLDNLNKSAATNRIRSMQGKPGPKKNKRRKSKKRSLDKRRKEENDLVQKYIVNPKKGDKEFNKKKKKSMDSGTYALLVILSLVIAFTIGIGVGIFALDFEDMSVVNANAIVNDTAFPDLENVTVVANTTNTNVSYEEVTVEDTYTSDNSYNDYYYDSGSESGGSSSQGGGSYDSGSESGGGYESYQSSQ